MPTHGKRACIYCRISEDREGLENGVGTQEADCTDLINGQGWELGRVYVDNDISASTLSSKPRPDYEQMIKDVEAGMWDVIVSLTNGRLTRRPMDLEGLIKLHDQTGVLITTVKSGTDDLSTADGRMVARIKASVDAAEAERTSERVARDVARRREAGLPHGGPKQFGFIHPSKDNGLRYLQELDEPAADGIRWASGRLLNGGTLSEVMGYWNGRKLYRPNGTPWLMHSNVQSTLSAPKLAGYTSEGGRAVARGAWPQIIDIGTHYELVKVLSPKKSKTGRSRKYLLPGFIFCDCGTGMVANVSPEYGLNRYLCSKQRGGCGRVSRFLPWCDEAVIAFVTGRLEARFDAPEPELPGQGSLELDIVAQEAEIERLRESVRLGVFTAGEVANDVISARAKIAELRKAQGVVAKQAARPRASVLDAIEVLQSTDRATLGARREIVARHVDKVIVHPIGKGGWGVNRPIPPDSISIIPVKLSWPGPT